MTYDPVLTAIAVNTNDALTDHLWRHDTTPGDPLGDLAITLHRAAWDFTTTSDLLTRTLETLHHRAGQHLDTLTRFAVLQRPHTLDTDALTLVQLLERFDTHHNALLSAYQLWRRHRPTTRNPRMRHLLPQPYDPTHGMVTLDAVDSGTATAWLVLPDDLAAEAFRLPTPATLAGEIRATDTGWQATAFTHPDHRTTHPHLVYPLPDTADEAAACRSLLRWWALHTADPDHSRTPAQLTAAERAALSA